VLPLLNLAEAATQEDYLAGKLFILCSVNNETACHGRIRSDAGPLPATWMWWVLRKWLVGMHAMTSGILQAILQAILNSRYSLVQKN
jgi:hypothetical protein